MEATIKLDEDEICAAIRMWVSVNLLGTDLLEVDKVVLERYGYGATVYLKRVANEPEAVSPPEKEKS